MSVAASDDIPRMWWKPADERGSECLSIEINGLKLYRRIWRPGMSNELLEWGWTLADTAVELAPLNTDEHPE